MDSSWEIALATRLDEIGEPWQRGGLTLNYIDSEGIHRKYHPDFWLPRLKIFIEIKGYWTKKVRSKMDCVIAQNDQKIIILDKFDKIIAWKP
jgi:hypothetical protein